MDTKKNNNFQLLNNSLIEKNDISHMIQIDLNSPYIDSILRLESQVFWEWFTNKEELLYQIKLSQSHIWNNTVWVIKDGILVWFWICYNGWNWDNNDVEIDNQFTELSQIAYIKTIIVDPNYQWKKEWVAILKHLLSKAILAWNKIALLHAWDWSPNNSSIRFFEKNWALKIKTYENKWFDDSLKNWWYCSKCWNPCRCWSVEMKINLITHE